MGAAFLALAILAETQNLEAQLSAFLCGFLLLLLPVHVSWRLCLVGGRCREGGDDTGTQGQGDNGQGNIGSEGDKRQGSTGSEGSIHAAETSRRSDHGRRNDRPREEKRSDRATEAEKAATRIKLGGRVRNDWPREEKRSKVGHGWADKAAESREGSNTNKAGQQGGRDSDRAIRQQDKEGTHVGMLTRGREGGDDAGTQGQGDKRQGSTGSEGSIHAAETSRRSDHGRRNGRSREEKRSDRATEAEKAATRIRLGNRATGWQRPSNQAARQGGHACRHVDKR
eukprot:s3038_g5.t1